jgi:hypothetical protein
VSETARVAYNVIADVASRAERLLLDPDPGKKAMEEVQGLDLMLDAGKKTIEMVSTSSSPLYALKDAPVEVQSAIKQAVHAINILKNIYYPKAEQR